MSSVCHKKQGLCCHCKPSTVLASRLSRLLTHPSCGPHCHQLDFGGKDGNAWLEYRLPAEQPRYVLDSYALTSANDEPARDPRHVALEAFSDGALGLQAVCALLLCSPVDPAALILWLGAGRCF